MPVQPGMETRLSQLHHAAFVIDGWESSLFAKLIALNTTYGWLACHHEQDAGFILGTSIHEQAEIVTIAVDPAFRRQGIASQLVGALAGQAKALGAASLFLEVAVTNIPAMALYRLLGFEDQRLRPNYYTLPGQPPIDALCMFKAL